MTVTPTLKSPRLQQLATALKQGNAEALDSFWANVRLQGTPLIEPIEGDEEHRLITFLWKEEAPLARLRLIGLLLEPLDSDLGRLGDTNLWFRSYIVQRNVRTTYQFFPQSQDDMGLPTSDGPARFASYKHDPLNPRTYTFERDEEDPEGFELIRSVLEMPDAPSQPWNAPRPGVPAGKVVMHRFASNILGNERRIWGYTPANYDTSRAKPYDVLVVFDGTGFVKMSTLPTVLDNLIASGATAPLVAIMPCSISQSLRLKELLLHKPFNEFLAQELWPWAHENYHLTRDPSRVVISGASAGGLAAAYAAFDHPELFGNVLSLSGAFAYAPGMLDGGVKGEHEVMAQLIARSEIKDLRFFLAAGTLETNSLRDLRGGPNLLLANRHFRTVLEAKGYPVVLSEFPGGHDMISWQGMFPQGLIALLT